MTYFEFMSDRIDAAKTVKPSQCGWGMMLSLVALGPIYSVVYTEVAVHPDGFLARGTAQDPDIPKGVAGAKWYEVPGIWWNTVERLSWTMLGKPATLVVNLDLLGFQNSLEQKIVCKIPVQASSARVLIMPTSPRTVMCPSWPC